MSSYPQLQPAAQHRPGSTRAARNQPEEVRIGLLGGFRVWVGPRVIEVDRWRLRKARSLIKLLALSTGHCLHREQVMEHLWPHLDRKDASNNLRRALHVARRPLEPDPSAPRYLISHGEHLALCPDGPLWVDVEAFEEVAANARRSRDPQAYRSALDLYAGDLLPADRYEGWAEDRHRQLRQLYLDLLIEMAELREECGNFRSAINALRETVSEEPQHEEAHADLMRLYAKSDQRYQALRQYEQLRQALRREFGTEPGIATRRLHEEIVAGHVPVARSVSQVGIPSESTSYPPRHNVPVALSSFVGRERELVEVKRALAMTRVLTLTGSGGCGKTRLALEVARDLATSYPDGAWLVELASLSHPELMPQAVASALGVREQPDRPLVDTLASHVREKDLLLILDNCEHLIEACAQLASSLLHSCPRLRVLATSRESMRMEGEAVWRVSSLSMPDTDRLPATGELTRYDAVRLFLDRTRLRMPDFDLTSENGPAVAQVCTRLEGMPLAIELATARVGALAVEEVAQRLGDSLSLLSAGPRTAPPRHRTMRATLEWSYGLLSEPESELFRRLSVFAGGFTLEAAEEVCAGGSIREGEVLDLLSSLVDKSLVVFEELQDGVARYRLLEPVRQYSFERLEENGEAGLLEERHAEHYLALAEEAEPELREQEAWLGRLEREHASFRAALSWALDRQDDQPGGRAELGLALAAALAQGRFWNAYGPSEGRRWLEKGLVETTTSLTPVRAKALREAGWIATHQGDYERAVSLLEESRSLFEELGDRPSVATSLVYLGHLALHGGDDERMRALGRDAEALRHELADRQAIARLLYLLGVAALIGGEHDKAIAHLQEGLALNRELGDSWNATICLTVLGVIALELGDCERAEALYREGLRLLQGLGDKTGISYGLRGMACAASLRADAPRAARLWGAAEAVSQTIGLPLSLFDRAHPDYEGLLDAARSRLGDEEAWEVASDEGRAMTPEEAIAYALSGVEEPPPSAAPAPEGLPAILTRREREVEIFVARGLTNRQIAKELVLSDRTVEKHVANILKKLGLHSREQVALR